MHDASTMVKVTPGSVNRQWETQYMQCSVSVGQLACGLTMQAMILMRASTYLVTVVPW